ncbi:MAG: hypothetical protein GY696_21155 [Gammaproteobacteria bacterium]|nr:hypothetical protein [Gammaproteobacteria bacterium]
MSFATTHANDFFVVLPSNSSLNYFPDNGPAKFRTHLATPIQLKGKWEVALAEIHYPHTWFTVEDMTMFSYYDGIELYNTVALKPGYYETMDNVIEEITGQFGNDAKENINIRYHFPKNKVEVELKSNAEIWWSLKSMAKLFGSRQPKSVEGGRYLLDDHINYKLGVSTLYVYTDIISPMLVGDSAVPLLKTVHVEGGHGDAIAKTYSKLHYVPLSTNNFQTIEINISDDLGKLISFQFGKVVVKLHFRPRRLAFM